MRVSRKQEGFTLIELVVVITILGILAAFAVPRFASLEVEARRASTQAIEGSVRSGAALAHALWLAQGATGADVEMEGVTINITNGYPDVDSIADVLADTTGFDTSTAGTFARDGASGTCEVTYANAPVNGVPVIDSDFDGC